jgi:ABC-2 type transport system ATP-binding protein
MNINRKLDKEHRPKTTLRNYKCFGWEKMKVIQTTKLTKAFDGFIALKDFDLTVEEGTIYGLIGPNGAGKTTAIRTMLGLLLPTSGTATILDTPVKDIKRVIHRIGYMPQDLSLAMELTIFENILFFGRLQGMAKRDIDARAEELLKLVELEKFGDRLIEACSGGMRRRASLACALVHDPPLLFLDEPTVGVDPDLRSAFWQYFRNLTEKNDKTIVLTTHYLTESEQCDIIGLLRDGMLAREGAPKDLKMEVPDGRGLKIRAPSVADAIIREVQDELGLQSQADGDFAVIRFTGDFDVTRILEIVQRHATTYGMELIEPTMDEVFSHFTSSKGTAKLAANQNVPDEPEVMI